MENCSAEKVICANCKHAPKYCDSDNDHEWYCGLTRTKINYVTGKVTMINDKCTHKNAHGRCADFEPI